MYYCIIDCIIVLQVPFKLISQQKWAKIILTMSQSHSPQQNPFSHFGMISFWLWIYWYVEKNMVHVSFHAFIIVWMDKHKNYYFKYYGLNCCNYHREEERGNIPLPYNRPWVLLSRWPIYLWPTFCRSHINPSDTNITIIHKNIQLYLAIM